MVVNSRKNTEPSVTFLYFKFSLASEISLFAACVPPVTDLQVGAVFIPQAGLQSIRAASETAWHKSVVVS
jgi:hypothetical protein